MFTLIEVKSKNCSTSLTPCLTRTSENLLILISGVKGKYGPLEKRPRLQISSVTVTGTKIGGRQVSFIMESVEDSIERNRSVVKGFNPREMV